MIGVTARIAYRTPFRLMSTVRSRISSVVSSIVPVRSRPVLLMRISIRPKVSRPFLIISSTCAREETSQIPATRLPPPFSISPRASS
jgi:hypothetical protein